MFPHFPQIPIFPITSPYHIFLQNIPNICQNSTRVELLEMSTLYLLYRGPYYEAFDHLFWIYTKSDESLIPPSSSLPRKVCSHANTGLSLTDKGRLIIYGMGRAYYGNPYNSRESPYLRLIFTQHTIWPLRNPKI